VHAQGKMAKVQEIDHWDQVDTAVCYVLGVAKFNDSVRLSTEKSQKNKRRAAKFGHVANYG